MLRTNRGRFLRNEGPVLVLPAENTYSLKAGGLRSLKEKDLRKFLEDYRHNDPKQVNAPLITDNNLRGLIKTGGNHIRDIDFTPLLEKVVENEEYKNA